jgi:DNA-binding PadR family transcriptional regulator
VTGSEGGGPPRKYFRLSSEGRRALERGLNEWKNARDAIDVALGPINTEVKL